MNAPEPQTAARASPLVGPYPIDEEALRKLKRLHDDGVIDDDEFKRGKLEALGLAEKIASAGALSRLPEDMLQNVLSFLVVKQDDIATRFLDNVNDMQHGVLNLHAELEEQYTEEDSVCYQYYGKEVVREGTFVRKRRLCEKDSRRCNELFHVVAGLQRIYETFQEDVPRSAIRSTRERVLA